MTRCAPWDAWLGEAHLLAGHLDEAMRLAGRGLELYRARKERGHEAWVLRFFGEIGSHPDSLAIERAASHYLEALTLSNELGMRPLVAHCHAGLAKRYRRTAKRAESDEHCTTATTMYREVGMTYWLEKAEREMKELG